MMIRLQKVLADAGVASRRHAEDLIIAGRVKVNGVIVTELGTKVDPDVDVILAEEKPIRAEKKIYLKMNKPRGYVCSLRTQEGDSIMKLVNVKERVYPVGRLDKESEGLIILTNDGEWALKMTHPKFEHEKEYIVRVEPAMSEPIRKKIEHASALDGEELAPMKVKFAPGDEEGKTLTFILHEGKKRQIRRLIERYGFRVAQLKRIRIGNVELGGLKPGQWVPFAPEK